jgi:hypothetical protein
MTRRTSSWWADDELELDRGDPSLVLVLDSDSTGSRRTGGLYERSDRMDRLARLEARVEELARAFGKPTVDGPDLSARIVDTIGKLSERLSRLEASVEATASAEEVDDLIVKSGDRWRRLDRAIDRLFQLHDCGSHVGPPEDCPICAFKLEYDPPEPEPDRG